MTVLEALAILEAATLECEKREVDTPGLRAALDFLEPHITPSTNQIQKSVAKSSTCLNLSTLFVA